MIKQMPKKRLIIWSSILAVGLIGLIIALTYAYFSTKVSSDSTPFQVHGGVISLNVSNNASNNTILPVLDSNIDNSNKVYKNTFTITRTLNSDVVDTCYSIGLKIDAIGSSLNNRFVKYRLKQGNTVVALGSLYNVNTGDTIELLPNQSLTTTNTSGNTYELTIWLSYDLTEDESFIMNSSSSSRNLQAHIITTNRDKICTKTNSTISINVTNGIANKTLITTSNNEDLSAYIIPNEGYKIAGAQVSCNNSTVQKKFSALTISNISQNDTCSVTLLEGHDNALEQQVLADNPTRNTRSDFDTTFTTTNTGTLYTTTATEDSSTVYYFSGDARNNWVVFGSETKDSTTYDICWRIIRTNTTLEGNGLRLLYSGVYDSTNEECGNTTEGYIGSAAYGSSVDNPSFVGYMRTDGDTLEADRGNTLNSLVKEAIDTWYSTKTNLGSLISSINTKAIYCNDRSVSKYSYSNSEAFNFGTYGRLVSNKTPSLKCGANVSGGLYEGTQSAADKFTADSTTGNGDLTYPVALMTADEVSFAGGKIFTTLSSPYVWYFKNKNNTGTAATDSITDTICWWTISPYGFGSGNAIEFFVNGSYNPCRLSNAHVIVSHGLRPAISLTSGTLWVSGDGSYNNPYRVE